MTQSDCIWQSYQSDPLDQTRLPSSWCADDFSRKGHPLHELLLCIAFPCSELFPRRSYFLLVPVDFSYNHSSLCSLNEMMTTICCCLQLSSISQQALFSVEFHLWNLWHQMDPVQMIIMEGLFVCSENARAVTGVKFQMKRNFLGGYDIKCTWTLSYGMAV